MIRYAALAGLALVACTPEAKPPAVAEQPTAPAVPQQASAGDAAKYKPAPAGEITVATPLAGARVATPLVVEGVAVNNWFFEGQFLAELAINGEVIAQAPAMQAGDKSWTDPGPVGFKAELSFNVASDQNADLILSEDMPAYVDEANDIRGPARSIRIPVVLVPSAK